LDAYRRAAMQFYVKSLRCILRVQSRSAIPIGAA
jgi:hypothetical protein